MDIFFESFLREKAADFRRIAAATKGEMTAEDLQSEAWLMAQVIGARRGSDIDFTDPGDQDRIFAALYVEHVRQGDWTHRLAASIDEESDDDEGGLAWSDRLAAHATSDPLTLLLLQETMVDAESILADSYSQAAAYVIIFSHFGNDRGKVCAFLVISDYTLYRRVKVAIHTVMFQPSLFDRIERIAEDFMPLAGRQYAERVELHCSANQWAWEF